MKQQDELDIFLSYVPAFKSWRIVVLNYFFQFLLFIFFIISFWWISSNYLFGALVAEFIIVFFGTLPYKYITKNSGKIRENYLKKYGRFAAQKLWFNYESYTIPFLSSSLYFPLMLIKYDFIPNIITLQPHFLTNSLFPFYISIPIGILIIIIGVKIKRPSGGFGELVESYIYLIYPDKSKLLKDGKYQYIRHPRYLGRATIAFGLAIIANNILAILVAAIHTGTFWSMIPYEEYELSNRFGDEYKSYKEKVPALIPRFGNWKKFLRYIFYNKK
jgi:protein-S-isoprenylcysteine O-methyltransferase Ste14